MNNNYIIRAAVNNDIIDTFNDLVSAMRSLQDYAIEDGTLVSTGEPENSRYYSVDWELYSVQDDRVIAFTYELL